MISFAGKPESESRGRYISSSPFDALGYGCNGKPAATSVGEPGCKTVFYLDGKTGKLALLYTSDARYVDAHGVRVGCRRRTSSVGCTSSCVSAAARSFNRHLRLTVSVSTLLQQLERGDSLAPVRGVVPAG